MPHGSRLLSPETRRLDIAQTIGKKDQSLPDGMKEEETPLGSDELLNELIATQEREGKFEDQLEKDILNEAKADEQVDQAAPPQSADTETNSKGPALVPALTREIKADVALPRRARKLRRSRTSSLVEADDARLKDLAHPIPPVMGTDDEREMIQRFTDKVHQCSMPADVIVKYNPSGGEEVRRSCLEELVEVIEGSEQARFLTNT